MRRTILSCFLLLTVLLNPSDRLDIATLRPVQTVAVTREAGGICIMTDTRDMGIGENISDALENLKQTTPGVIYLDTADYLLLDEDVQEEALALKEWMAKSVVVYRLLGRPDLLTVSQYLQIHGGGLEIDRWEKESELPVLDGREERLRLI